MTLRTFRFAVALAGIALSGNSAAHEATCDCDRSAATPLEWHTRWYAGAAADANSFGEEWSTVRRINDGSFSAVMSDESSTGYRVFAGAEFLDHFTVEAGYVDFGEITFNAQSDGSGFFWNAGPIAERMSATALTLTGSARMALFARTSLFVRAGAHQWESEDVVSGSVQGSGPVAFTEDRSGTSFIYGGGLDFEPLPSVRLRGAYEMTEFSAFNLADNDAHLTMLEASIAWRF
jgi:OmpA-OmpF porin, OOP family